MSTLQAFAICLLLCCSTLMSCSARSKSQPDEQASAHTQSTTAIPAPQGTSALSDTILAGHWSHGNASTAGELFAREDWKAAREAFRALVSEDDATRARVALMIAICDAWLGNHQEAALEFEKSLATMPFLADYLHNAAARSYYFAHDRDQAMLHAHKVSQASIHGADAQLLIGDILRARSDAQATYDHYKAYLDARANGIRRPEARFRVGEASVALGKALEAAEHFKTITVEAPLTRWASEARIQLTALVKKLPVDKRSAVMTLDASEHITRAEVLYHNNRNEESEEAFAAALEASGLTPERRCTAAYHRANSVYKQRDRTRAAPLFVEALALCKAASNVDLFVKSAYQGGRSFATLGDHEKAIHYYGLVESEHPEHSYADDARLLQAEEYDKLQQQSKVDALLSSISEKYPQGDMGTEALWRLAWRSYKSKDYGKAIVWLQKQIESAPIDDRFWAEGQAQYWIGRAQGKLGATKESILAYRAVIGDYPLSYYALLALNRLRESHPKVFAEVALEIHQEPGTDNGVFQFRERDEYQSPAFARAIEFLRLGLSREAAAELSRLGFKSPTGRDRLEDADEIDRTWAMAFLHYSIGNFSRALWSTRWHVLDYNRHWPEGGWRKRWEIAYPPGYWQLIEKHAKEQGIPPELLISFVREESGFDPIQESFANAIGLSQLIMPTARRFADGIEVNRENLRDPDKNLRIGARFMAFLMKKWSQQVTLVVPSYNAGEGAVARWVEERGSWDRDAWAEEIPYDETRRYSKRVIASYFTYRYLLHDEIPLMPNQN